MKTLSQLITEAVLLQESKAISLIQKCFDGEFDIIDTIKGINFKHEDFRLKINPNKIELLSKVHRVQNNNLKFDEGRIVTDTTNGEFFVKLSGSVEIDGEIYQLKKTKISLRKGYGKGHYPDVDKLLSNPETLKIAANVVKYNKDYDTGEVPINLNLFSKYSSTLKLVDSQTGIHKERKLNHILSNTGVTLVFDEKTGESHGPQINSGKQLTQKITFNLRTKKVRVYFQNGWDSVSRSKLGKIWFEFSNNIPLQEISLPI